MDKACFGTSGHEKSAILEGFQMAVQNFASSEVSVDNRKLPRTSVTLK
jgi:hypothetical protein